MNDYKLTFKLKQHTPIIHFQHDQYGATLRSSELKPKLDKFLIGRFKENKIAFKQWLIGNGENEALNYKVKIIDCDNTPKKGVVQVMPSTIENWIISKNLTFFLTAGNKALCSSIRDEIDFFFVKTNFGKRKSKGFGCFYPNKMKENDFIEKLKNNNQVLFKCDQSLRNSIQEDTYFYDKIITRSWGKLKSGKNYNGYEKSRVFDYLCDNQLRWDKRWIKIKLKELVNDGILPEDLQYTNQPQDCSSTNSWEDSSNLDYKFGRALLGLAEHYEFRAKNGYLYQVKIMHSTIERFKAPVTFKVFNKNIYAIAEDIDSFIFDTDFSFEIILKQNNKQIGSPIIISETLSTPNKDKFNLIEFLNNYFPTVGFERVNL